MPWEVSDVNKVARKGKNYILEVTGLPFQVSEANVLWRIATLQGLLPKAVVNGVNFRYWKRVDMYKNREAPEPREEFLKDDVDYL